MVVMGIAVIAGGPIPMPFPRLFEILLLVICFYGISAVQDSRIPSELFFCIWQLSIKGEEVSSIRAPFDEVRGPPAYSIIQCWRIEPDTKFPFRS